MIKAKLRHLRMSPRKVRLVADAIRGLDVESAQNQLEFMNKRAARPMLKLLKSAVANAEHNSAAAGLKRDNLYISELRVDEGPTLKRWMPRAMGRATPINKRTSHITIVLDEKTAITENSEKTLRTQKKSSESSADSSETSVLAGEPFKKQKAKLAKPKVVKSLDEVKEIGKREEVETKVEKPVSEEHKKEPFDVRREGSDRGKQHLDTVRKKAKGGILKRMFRRKSI